jgi:hypothetical protein
MNPDNCKTDPFNKASGEILNIFNETLLKVDGNRYINTKYIKQMYVEDISKCLIIHGQRYDHQISNPYYKICGQDDIKRLVENLFSYELDKWYDKKYKKSNR